MFGLVPLQHVLNPSNTLEKFVFLVKHVPTHMHKTTTMISFVALSVLVLLRYAKGWFKKYPIIYRLPEVLIVVVVSTCKSSFNSRDLWGLLTILRQSFQTSSVGTMTASTS